MSVLHSSVGDLYEIPPAGNTTTAPLVFDLTKEAKLSERSKHTFQFTAKQISDSAAAEEEYHDRRVSHWAEREQAAYAKVKETASVEITQHEVTGGQQYHAAVRYGDPEAWAELQLASGKVQSHRRAAERFHSDAALYGSQTDGYIYQLDADDVAHFRLAGQTRED